MSSHYRTRRASLAVAGAMLLASLAGLLAFGAADAGATEPDRLYAQLSRSSIVNVTTGEDLTRAVGVTLKSGDRIDLSFTLASHSEPGPFVQYWIVLDGMKGEIPQIDNGTVHFSFIVPDGLGGASHFVGVETDPMADQPAYNVGGLGFYVAGNAIGAMRPLCLDATTGTFVEGSCARPVDASAAPEEDAMQPAAPAVSGPAGDAPATGAAEQAASAPSPAPQAAEAAEAAAPRSQTSGLPLAVAAAALGAATAGLVLRLVYRRVQRERSYRALARRD